MRIELDISLVNPTKIFDLNVLKCNLLNTNYKLLQYRTNNYLLLQNTIENFKIRIHEDGRIYLKIDIDLKVDTTRNQLLRKLLKKLKKFLDDMLINQNTLKNEINFSFHGNEAQSFFWKNYDELNMIGKDVLNIYDLRTYTDNDSIYVKLESSNPINMEQF